MQQNRALCGLKIDHVRFGGVAVDLDVVVHVVGLLLHLLQESQARTVTHDSLAITSRRQVHQLLGWQGNI